MNKFRMNIDGKEVFGLPGSDNPGGCQRKRHFYSDSLL